MDLFKFKPNSKSTGSSQEASPNPEKSDSSRERLYQPIKFQTRNITTRTVTGVTTRSKSRTTQDPSEPAEAEIYRSPWTRDSSYHGGIEFKI